MTGEETYRQLTAFAEECRVFLDSQPPALAALAGGALIQEEPKIACLLEAC